MMEPELTETIDFGGNIDNNNNNNKKEEGHSNPAKIARSATGSIPVAHDTPINETMATVVAAANANSSIESGGTPSKSTLTPMEISQGDDGDNDDDMESLLPSSSSSNGGGGGNGGIANESGSGSGGGHKLMGKTTKTYLNGYIRPVPIGNMHILFPEYFATSGWGVLGPQWFGPACVWGILLVATHFCLRKAHRLGKNSDDYDDDDVVSSFWSSISISAMICYIFFGVATFLLTDVSFRDPGICFYTEIPETVPSDQVRGWRWCDFCQVYQPPDGAHCPDCNVCVAGYDHHCVWMGTCIGKKNYRQFVKFNISWLYYAGYALFWLALFGPLLEGLQDD